MSRSKRNTPKKGITSAKTESDNKRQANRKLRRVTRIKVKKGESELPDIKEISNVWAFDKDGKQYLKKPTPKDLRKWRARLTNTPSTQHSVYASLG